MSNLKTTPHICLVFVLAILLPCGALLLCKELLVSIPIAHTLLTFSTCFPIFFMGSLVAFFYKRAEDRELNGLLSSAYPRISYIVACLNVLLQVAVVRLRFALPFRHHLFYYYANGVLLATHMFLMLIGAPNMFTEWLSNSWILCKMGKYSFGAYLFHMLIIANMQRIPLLDWARIPADDKVLLTFAASFLIAYFFFHLVENNMLRMANYINQKMSGFLDQFTTDKSNISTFLLV